MNKYTKKYILSIIVVILLTIIISMIWIILDEIGAYKPWAITVLFASCLTSVTHIVSGVIYDENKDEKSNLNISNSAIGCIFLVSLISQIACTLIVIIDAWKRFSSIYFIEYIIGAIFMYTSAYFFKKASYKLIDKEKKNG